MDLSRIIEFAVRHHGLIDRAHAAELGTRKSAWYWALESGRLDLVHPGVARIPGSAATAEQRILAAVWASGDGAVASHRSAAHLWCPAEPPALVDLIIPRRSRHRELPGVVVHRPTDAADLRPSLRHQIWATNPLRVLLDIGAVDPPAVGPFLERSVVAGLVSPAAARAALERHQRRGRAGTTALREALDDWTLNSKPPDSLLEEVMSRLLLRYGLPPATFHAHLCGFEVDFLIAGRLVVECDGWETHGLRRENFEADRLRDSALTAAGYAVVRFTWRHIRRRPAFVAGRLRAVLARIAPESILGVTPSARADQV